MEEGKRRVDRHVSEVTVYVLVMLAARDGKVGLLVHHFGPNGIESLVMPRLLSQLALMTPRLFLLRLLLKKPQ